MALPTPMPAPQPPQARRENAGNKLSARNTFIIDPEGKVVRVFPSVKIDRHSEEVLAALLSYRKDRDPESKFIQFSNSFTDSARPREIDERTENWIN
jgi:hypothetical protein